MDEKSLLYSWTTTHFTRGVAIIIGSHLLYIHMRMGGRIMIIGLTGGIGTGKSTVSNMLREYHIPIVDADIIARQVVEPGEEAYNEVVKYFGEEILTKDQLIDRKILGAIVFSDEN